MYYVYMHLYIIFFIHTVLYVFFIHYCLSLSMRIYICNLDQVIWLAEN